jgi:DNA helicase HerA-like ATPase
MTQIIEIGSTVPQTKYEFYNPVKLDIQKVIEGRALIQANSGGGKSYLLRKILEESNGKVQQIIIDPEGEYSTLREKFDNYILFVRIFSRGFKNEHIIKKTCN